MDNTKTFELKVGTFILMGIAILFLIVFSVGDIKVSKSGYRIKVYFNFASGIGGAAPVRLAGVGVGRVEGIRIVRDAADATKAELSVWINDAAKVEKDATVTINTLGMLGEKYLEIIPGTPGETILKNNDTIIGKDPVSMEKVTENLANLSGSIEEIADKLNRGEGTIGKLLTKDEVYNDVKVMTTNFKEFSQDIKEHPWKLLNKPRGE